MSPLLGCSTKLQGTDMARTFGSSPQPIFGGNTGVGVGNFPTRQFLGGRRMDDGQQQPIAAPAVEPLERPSNVPPPPPGSPAQGQDRASEMASQNPNRGNGTMSQGTAVVDAPAPGQIGPKMQAFGIPEAGMTVPVKGLGQGTARPPLPGQMINSNGLIGKQMQPR